MRPLVKGAAAVLLAAPLTMLAQGAQARIVCQDQFQIIRGEALPTPYCADHYLAQVARSYGMRISANDVRNPSTKRRICEFIGNDTRIYSICSGWRPEGGGNSRR